jgi:glycopeptide antibiotics resistance protein
VVTSVNVHLARLAGWFLLLAVVTVILGATLGHSQAGYHSANLRPGHDIWLELRHVSAQTGVVNILGNIVMFVPVGFLLVTAVGDGVRRAVVGGALLSATIECCQYQIGRAADIDDVLLNATGALLGALGAVLAVRALDRVRRIRARAVHR